MRRSQITPSGCLALSFAALCACTTYSPIRPDQLTPSRQIRADFEGPRDVSFRSGGNADSVATRRVKRVSGRLTSMSADTLEVTSGSSVESTKTDIARFAIDSTVSFKARHTSAVRTALLVAGLGVTVVYSIAAIELANSEFTFKY
jgi:hypothetical protein